ncbi:M23 family metallopeptidase [Jatrophihabitans sp.]|uniref:M23 family metallopeptidase n=1 Tax=Jatrophihabitans sp. TaxID=1932789 RepID=UPI002C10FDD3|nr:M23 family metallopeptidase [Jatrophihabitans sp.]
MHLVTMAMLATLLTTGSVAVAGGGSAPGSAGVPGLAGAVPGLAGAVPVTASPYRAPLAAVRVLRPFSPPPDRYGPGHLGVDLAAPAGVAVQATGDGVVRFAGPVAGRGVVVVLHPDGISTEYEPLAVAVRAGQPVSAGQRLGTVAGVHRGCAPAGCLHWGARRGGSYLDPMSLLRPLGVVRLLPWD